VAAAAFDGRISVVAAAARPAPVRKERLDGVKRLVLMLIESLHWLKSCGNDACDMPIDAVPQVKPAAAITK
jgi:hypothetical protein